MTDEEFKKAKERSFDIIEELGNDLVVLKERDFDAQDSAETVGIMTVTALNNVTAVLWVIADEVRNQNG